MKKICKKFLGATLSIATIISSFAPMAVLAEGTYDIIVTLDDGYTATADGDKLRVYRPGDTNKEDPHFTEARNVANNESVGTASCTDDTHCKITIDDEITTKFNTSEPVFFGDNHFDLNQEINANTSLKIKLNNQEPEQQENNVVVHLDGATVSTVVNVTTITFNVDNTSVPVVINPMNNATYNVNGMNIEIPESNTHNVKFQLPNNFDRQKYEVYALVGDNTSVVSLSGDNDFSVGGYTGELHLGIRLINNNNEPEPYNDPNAGPDGPRFDGKAYIIWSCGTGICYKYYDNIPDFDDGNSYFIKDTTVEADNNEGQTFNVKAKYKYWATKDGFDSWVNSYKQYKNIENIDWTKVNPEDMIGEPIDIRPYEEEAEKSGACTKSEPQDVFEACVNNYAASKGVWTARAQLQPVGEPNDNNAYVSYGDRNFKVVIYNSKFKGITLGSLDDLDYYFNEWTNPFLRQDQFDISGTTKAKPTGITTSLFEKTVNIKTLDYNGFEIKKIEALDVPADAVDIKQVDGEWKITFSSSFYDNVVFKVTDSDGDVSYFSIKRTTVDAWTPWINGKPVYNADFYFEDTKSYTDFILTARLYFKDGTYKDVTLKAAKGIDDGLGNIDEDNYEISGGKGLKKSSFRYELTEEEARNIKKAYTNVELKGSTSTKFAGTYAGSGKGVKANIYDPEEDV